MSVNLYKTFQDTAKLIWMALTLHFQEDATIAAEAFAWSPDEDHTQIQIIEYGAAIESVYPQISFGIRTGSAVELGFGQEGDRLIDDNNIAYKTWGGQMDVSIEAKAKSRSSLDRKRLGDLLSRALIRKIRPVMESNGIYYKNAFVFNGYSEEVVTGAREQLYVATFTLPVRISWRDYEPLDPTVPKTRVTAFATIDDTIASFGFNYSEYLNQT